MEDTKARDEAITLGIVMILAAAGFMILCAVWGQDATTACSLYATAYANCNG